MSGGRLAAVTGATGFLGAHLVRTLGEQGWRVRILARRDPIHPLWGDVVPEVIPGALGDPRALSDLCAGADAVIHVAGVVKARTRADFFAANATGARRVAEAAASADARHAVLISSQAAREPQLSDYAASKRAGEDEMREVLGERLSIVRPPVIYGPGDREILGLFQAAAALPVLPVFDPRARIAVIHVADAARQIAALAAGEPLSRTVTLSDSRPSGYGWRDLMAAAAASCGTQPAMIRLPDSVFNLVGLGGLAARFLGGTPMVTPEKVREIRHLDWGVAPEEQAAAMPDASFGLLDGFLQTAASYRAAGWLKDRHPSPT